MPCSYDFSALAILGSGFIPVLFRAFDGWRVNVFWAIPINYLTCAVVGHIWAGQSLDLSRICRRQPWVGLALVQGVILAVNFFLLAYTAQRAGRGGRGIGQPVVSRDPGGVWRFCSMAILSTREDRRFGGGAVCLVPMHGARREVALRSFVVDQAAAAFGILLLLAVTSRSLNTPRLTILNESTYHPYVMAGFLFAFFTSLVIGMARKLITPVRFSRSNTCSQECFSAWSTTPPCTRLSKCSLSKAGKLHSFIRFTVSEWSA